MAWQKGALQVLGGGLTGRELNERMGGQMLVLQELEHTAQSADTAVWQPFYIRTTPLVRQQELHQEQQQQQQQQQQQLTAIANSRSRGPVL
jgi:CRISPR/Cas system-associated endonuclease Cas1